MSKKTTAAHSTNAVAHPRAKMSVQERIVSVIRNEGIKEAPAERAAEKILTVSLLGWLRTQSEETRADIFVAIEAGLSQSDCGKLQVLDSRPQIDPARIEAARDERAAAAAQARAEKLRVTETAKRQREEARQEREAAKLAAKRAKFEALRAELEGAADNDDAARDAS